MRSIKAIVFAISLMVLVIAPFTLFDGQVWYKQFWGEKFYEEQELRVEALVLPDGSMSVRETRVLLFHGDFSRYRRNIPLVGYSNMVDVQVSEPNKPYVAIQSASGRPEGRFQFTKARVGREDQFIIELFFNARDEKRTFVIEYRVLDVVKVHNDIAELNWKFIGNQRSVGIDRMSVALNLPPGAGVEEVKVWGHGPLKGGVRRVSPEQVTWQTTDLPKSRFLEGRVLFPTRLVPQGRMLTKRDALAEILLQEKGWADIRSAEQQKAIISLAFSALMTIFGLFIAWWLHQRYGKKFRLPMEIDYYRELPGNYTPAEAGWFLDKERLQPKVMGATLMDLARRGYLRMEPTDNAGKTDIVLRQLRPAGEELAVHERLLLDFFFNQVGHMHPAIWFSSIKDFRKADPGATKAFVDSFRSVVSASVDSMNFFDRVRSGQGFAYLGLFISIAMVFYYQSDRAIFQTFGSILTTVAFMTVILKARDLTEIGQNQYDLWMAFRRFLKDFSNLDRAQLPQLILWEHYLVYAVVLGVAAEVIKQLPFVYPQVNEPNNDFGYYWGGMYHTGYASDGSTMSSFHGLSAVDSMVSSLNSDWDNALSGLSGGSGFGGSGGDSGGGGDGGGGGFSGGGGDGGGGGGGDAD